MKIFNLYIIKKFTYTSLLISLSLSIDADELGEWIKDERSGCEFWIDCVAQNESISWSGNCKNGKASGKGKLQLFLNNEVISTYEGEFLDGKQHGRGSYVHGDIEYTGEWRGGQIFGEGILIEADGSKYKGEFYNGKRHGNGTYIWNDGSKYAGGWFYGKQHGHGILTKVDGSKYAGEWLYGKQHGDGVLTKADGVKYVGEFSNSKIHGNGVLTEADGVKYIGEFRNGEIHGKGTIIEADGNKYVGEFRDSKRLK